MKFFGFKKKPAKEEEPTKAGLFSKLRKTRDNLTSGISALFQGAERIDDAVFDDLEDQLVMADLGVAVSASLVDQLRADVKAQKITDPQQVVERLRALMTEQLQQSTSQEAASEAASIDGPKVIMMVGVNGVGKTTTTAKLAARFKQQGQAVLLAAGDTFRAAAVEQLQQWGERLDIPVVAQGHGSDAAAVAFDAYSSAKARDMDVLLIDTAGRQHTSVDLMDQLGKVQRVLQKIDATAPHEVWLTVDAGNGQNVLVQIEQFNRQIPLTGICVTKLDGTAKGGVIVAVAERFALPIRFIGLGEQVADLQPFDAEQFAAALLPDLQ